MPDPDDLAALTVAELVAHIRELRHANAQLRRQLRPAGPPLAGQALAEEMIRQTALLAQLGMEFRADLEPAALIQQALQTITLRLPADEATVILVGTDQKPTHALTAALGALRPLPLERAAELLTNGSAGWSLRHGSSVVLFDIAGEAQRFQLQELQTAGSLIVTPIRQASATVGVLMVYRLAPHAFSSLELALIESIAAQLGIALASLRIHQQDRARQQQILTLLTIGQLQTTEHALAEIATRCHTIAIENFGARWGLLFLRPSPQNHPEWIAPTDQTMVDAPVTAASGAAQLTADSQSVVTMALTDELTCVALPLIHEGAALGSLALGYTTPQHQSLAIDWSLLDMFARQIATVCATQQLFSRLREQAQLLEALVNERTNQLQRSRDLLRIVFDSLPDGLLLIDETERLAAANTAFAHQVIGRHPRDLVGKTYAHLMRLIERAAPTSIELLPDARAGRQRLRLRQAMADGERRYIIERMEITPVAGEASSRLEFWRRDV